MNNIDVDKVLSDISLNLPYSDINSDECLSKIKLKEGKKIFNYKPLLSVCISVIIIAFGIFSGLYFNNLNKNDNISDNNKAPSMDDNFSSMFSINSYDEEVTLDLDYYNVKNYQRKKYQNSLESISFNVNSMNDYFKSVIEKSCYYNSSLNFEVEGYYAYGFLIKMNHIFNYKMADNYVEIIEIAGDYINDYNALDYSKLPIYHIIAPIRLSLAYSYLNGTDIEKEYYCSLTDKNITYEMLVKVYSYIENDFYLINNDCIYLKGYVVDNGKITLSSDYLIVLDKNCVVSSYERN